MTHSWHEAADLFSWGINTITLDVSILNHVRRKLSVLFENTSQNTTKVISLLVEVRRSIRVAQLTHPSRTSPSLAISAFFGVILKMRLFLRCGFLFIYFGIWPAWLRECATIDFYFCEFSQSSRNTSSNTNVTMRGEPARQVGKSPWPRSFPIAPLSV